jgi:hypothetical protein
VVESLVMKKKPKGNPDPEFWGYDPKLVPKIDCLICDLPIGDRPYKEITAFGRFGEMLFNHVDCEDLIGRIKRVLDSEPKGLRRSRVADELGLDRKFVKHLFSVLHGRGHIEPCPITKRWRCR